MSRKSSSWREKIVSRIPPYLQFKSTNSHDIDFNEPCYSLWKNEVPALVWLEGALAAHGSSHTQEWEIDILVDDSAKAATFLRTAGYRDSKELCRFEDEPEFAQRAVSMSRPHTQTRLVLLPAKDWHYTLLEHAEGFVPTLHDFLDALLETWLQISAQDYVDRLSFALYIGSMIRHCYRLRDAEGQAVNEIAYAQYLRVEHREFHYDMVSDDRSVGCFTTTERHQYHVRRWREIQEGIFTPQPYKKGAYRPDLTPLSE